MSAEVTRPPSAAPELLLTLTEVATRLGLPLFKVRRAAKIGIFPTYNLFNGRKLARLSEVIVAIERSRHE